MFQSAVRAPDHGRLRPWRFVVIEGDKRAALGELMVEADKAMYEKKRSARKAV